MIIDKALRRRMKKLLPKNYRQLVVERLKEKGRVYHPNTVRNVLNGSPNMEVAQELLDLLKEQQDSVNSFRKHADAIVGEAA
jgi:hypothetical protein